MNNSESLTSPLCGFNGEQKVQVRIDEKELTLSFNELATEYNFKHGDIINVKTTNGHYEPNKPCTCYADAYFIKLKNNRDMYSIKLYGIDKPIVCTDNHIHPTDAGHLTTKEIYDKYQGSKKGCLFGLIKIQEDINDVTVIDIESIVKCSSPEYVYCFEMIDTSHPYFLLDNSINTHSCILHKED